MNDEKRVEIDLTTGLPKIVSVPKPVIEEHISYGGTAGSAVDSVNGQTGVVVLDTDDVSEGSTNLYSQWEEVTVSGETYLTPQNLTNGLTVGQALDSSVVSAFGSANSWFNGTPTTGSDGISYFGLLGYGTSFVALGGTFITGHARGTAAAPTQTQSGDYLSYMMPVGYGSSAWVNSGASHIAQGMYFLATNTPTTAIEKKWVVGGLTTPMLSWDSATNAIKFNESMLDADMTWYYDSGTAFSLDGGTGVTTFAIDPLIPDEAYGSGWNGVLEPPTKNAVYDKVEAYASDTVTFTNKRVTPRVGSTSSSATPTINTDNVDAYSITAQAADITSFTTNLSGTPTNFQRLTIRIKDNGTARAITWGASFEAKGVALPTTTVLSKVLTVGFIYDTVTAKWGCVASAQEA